MNVPMWNSGPEFRKTACSSMPCHGAMSSALGEQRARRQHRRVRPAGERRGVHEQQRIVGRCRRGRDRRRRPARRRTPRTRRARRSRSCHNQRAPAAVAARAACGRRSRRRPRRADLPRRRGSRSSITNASSSAPWRQFAGQNNAPSLRAREQQLLEPERVLAEPQHPVAAARRPRRASAFATRFVRTSVSCHVRRTSPSPRHSASARERAYDRSDVGEGQARGRKHGTEPSSTSYHSSATGMPISTTSGGHPTTSPISRHPFVSGSSTTR